MQRKGSVSEKHIVKVSSIWDHHGHLSMLGGRFDKLNLEKISSPLELYKLLENITREKDKGEWILGSNLNPSLWEEESLELNKIDKLTPYNPLFLERLDAHSAVVNSISIKLSKLNPKINSEGGFFEKKNGVLTGVIVDSLVEKVLKSIGETSEKKIEKIFRRAFAELKKNGLSGATDMMISEKEAEVLRKMDREKTIELPVLGYLKWSKDQNIPNFLYKGEKYVENGIKIFLDGALGSRGAFLREPYCDDKENFGILNYSEKEICEILKECNKKNVNLSFHIIGDGALETFLNSFEKTGKLGVEIRLEHLQITPKELLQRLRKIDVVISLQPSHYISDRKWAEKRIGSERMANSYLLKSLISRKKNYLFGTDFPIEPSDPKRTIKGCLERMKEERIPLSKILYGMKVPRQFLKFAKPCAISLRLKSENSKEIYSEIGIRYLNEAN